jgi:hypothetical protein
MNHRLACLAVTGLALAAAPQTTTSASVYPTPNVEILVGGSPLRQYPYQGRCTVEALKAGSTPFVCAIPYGVRVAIALSVDGLNTIDARQTSAAGARKWVLDPYETVTISGWQTSQREARRFEFTTEEQSYGQALGKTANLGVISAAFSGSACRFPSAANQQWIRRASRRRRHRLLPRRRRKERRLNRSAWNARKRPTNMPPLAWAARLTTRSRKVWLELEDAPAQTVNLRYEFRPQLVKLGILPPVSTTSERLDRRERARGFEPGFAPVPPSLR